MFPGRTEGGISDVKRRATRLRCIAYRLGSGLASTEPLPSLIVTSRLAATAANFSTDPLGQRTSISAFSAAPSPKCSREIIGRVKARLAQHLLRLHFAAIASGTRAPIALRLDLRSNQLHLQPAASPVTSLRRSEGGSFRFKIKISTSPSLSKSPNAQPRLA